MSTPPHIQLEVFGKTDVGLVREHNEDNFLVADVTAATRSSDAREPLNITLGDKGALLLVCDCMGGAAAGEVASQMAVDSIYDALRAAAPQARDDFARLLRAAVEHANEKIFIQSRDNQSERGMGTTCTVAGLVDSTLVIGQIGDSRCYVLRDGKLAQVTKDQSLAWQLIEAGAMTAEEAKAFEHANIILQALGVQERVEVVLSQVELRRGDVALLCSDGLHGPVSDEEILAVLIAEPNLQLAGEALVQKALDRDGPDNITVVLARFDGEGLEPPTADDAVAFVPYDPGSAPVADPPGRPSSIGHETLEEPIPQELTSTEEVVTKTDTPLPASGPTAVRAARNPRSLLAFLFLVLLAAGAGGILAMRCDEPARESRSSAP